MRGSHSRPLAYSVYSGVGLQPRPLFFADRHDMPRRHSEVSPSCKGSSDVNRSIGFVVRGLWSVKARNDDESETNNTPTTTTVQRRYFKGTPKLRGCYSPRDCVSR